MNEYWKPGAVDPSKPHVVVAHGDDDPWVEVARIDCGTSPPTVETLTGDSDIRSELERFLDRHLDPESGMTTVFRLDGGDPVDWTGTLRQRAGSTSNMYGTMHLISRSGR